MVGCEWWGVSGGVWVCGEWGVCVHARVCITINSLSHCPLDVCFPS